VIRRRMLAAVGVVLAAALPLAACGSGGDETSAESGPVTLTVSVWNLKDTPEFQALVGEMFHSVQGGRYAHPVVAELIERLLSEGAAGAGQSSWGPALYGLFPDEAAARRVADRVAALAGGPLVVITAFANHGAACRRGSVS